jgi:hypothetical protein
VATISVDAAVAPGKYTITLVGTGSSPNIEYVQLRLLVAVNPNFPVAGYLLQADGSSLFLLADLSGAILV